MKPCVRRLCLNLDFVRSCLAVASRRVKLLAFLNSLFFGCVLATMFVAQLLLPPALFQGWPLMFPWALWNSWFLVFLVIFSFNLLVGAFIMVTLPGMLCFPLSVGFLAYRAALWGLLFYAVPSWLFFVALPLVVLEGEAYVVAAAGGFVVGLSWVRPRMLYGDQALARSAGLRRGLRECLRLYLFVVVLLLVAVAVETIALVMTG
jgi:hypothetical protein